MCVYFFLNYYSAYSKWTKQDRRIPDKHVKKNSPGPTHAHWQIMDQPKSYWCSHRTLWVCAHQTVFKMEKKKSCLVRTCIAGTSKRPMRHVLFEAGTNLPRAVHTRRVGKPRANWLLETYNDAFHLIDCHTPFDINNRMHLNMLAERAQTREPPFTTKQRNS